MVNFDHSMRLTNESKDWVNLEKRFRKKAGTTLLQDQFAEIALRHSDRIIIQTIWIDDQTYSSSISAKRYPTPRTAMINLGLEGSFSTFFLNLPIWISMTLSITATSHLG
jgi:hypothetical protein